MNSMFGKSFEPITQSERIKKKRNKEIFKSVKSSNDICLDNNGNIKSAKNYESYLNTVNGFYECKKSDPINNKDCFNTYLDSDLDSFSVANFQDVKANTVNFQIYDENDTKEARGRRNVKAKTDGSNTFHTVAEFVTDDLINPESGINSSVNITYPYNKQGLCANYVIQDVSYFDPSGNFNANHAKDVKHYFPMSKISVNMNDNYVDPNANTDPTADPTADPNAN